jgi:nucleoid-associated protein YgaU
MSRYKKRKIARNEIYKNDDIFINRGVEAVNQYTTPKFKNPTDEELLKIPYVSHYWVTGDRYFKLAQKYYNDSKLWYIIALFNKKPTEAQVELGDEIRIPTDIILAVEILG